jgi:hypothetical protein
MFFSVLPIPAGLTQNQVSSRKCWFGSDRGHRRVMTDAAEAEIQHAVENLRAYLKILCGMLRRMEEEVRSMNTRNLRPAGKSFAPAAGMR